MAPRSPKIPRRILIFGASGRIGSPLARYLLDQNPDVQLRLVTSKDDKRTELEKAWPSCEVVVADYYDVPSLSEAVEGMEGVFLITTGGTDEHRAMTNVVSALKSAGGQVLHIIRLIGLFPGFNPHRVPQVFRDRGGLPAQHADAKKILEDSLLPVTFLNSGATFMDNYHWMKQGLRDHHRLIWPSRLVPFIDPADIAEIAARLFLSHDHRHIGQFHTLNNGNDLLTCDDVAQIMSRVWGVPITTDTSKEGFFRTYAHLGNERLEYLWTFFKFEEDNEVAWSLNDCAERILGRKPKTVEQWLKENRAAILGV